jgi:dUTP pyrophosphatase
MNINILNRSEHKLPAYSKALPAGMDIRAGIDEDIVIKPIDSDYRGEVCVIIVNLSMENFVINDGEGICQ